ncbi:DoxX family protein [uncultured Microbulbifer sp.]|uniref:DoxX family protein n=1 Tax=uncultured Microbulbifer sp. TaxID=348147 RepID=UPI0025F8FFB0|nr:DoxX family protein [uncultured Microbulbifer sp.]
MNTYLERVLHTNSNIAALILRVPVGIILSAHGAQKLFGAFGGYGLEGTGQWMASIGLEPGYLMALLAGNAEFFGGIALVLGLLTRPAALISAFTMLVALFVVHLENGLFMSNNGYEFALALLMSTTALVFQGGGTFSLDRAFTKKDNFTSMLSNDIREA